VGKSLVKHDVIVLMAVINAYEEIRSELSQYEFVKTVYLDCPLNILIERDTKGLYKRAFLSDRHEAKINNLTGVNDPFEIPENPDLVLYTAEEDIKTSSEKLLNFILGTLERGK
jgi:adenylylsulfate kinase